MPIQTDFLNLQSCGIHDLQRIGDARMRELRSEGSSVGSDRSSVGSDASDRSEEDALQDYLTLAEQEADTGARLKTHALQQAMMQELLTGRTRLV